VAGAVAVASGVAEALKVGSNLDSVLNAMLAGARRGTERAREVIAVTTEGRVPWEVIAAQINPALADRMEWALEVVDRAAGSPAERRDVLARKIGTGVQMIETIPFVVGALRIADGDPFEAAVLAANAGGDTDSLAAIAGGIGGALKGAGAIPEALRRRFQEVNRVSLEDVAAGLAARVRA